MSEQEQQETDPTTGLYLVIAVVVSLLVAIVFKGMRIDGTMYHPGFVARCFMFLLGVPGGFVGLKIGRWVRDVTRPDAIITTDGMKGIIKAKLFWAFVPQAMGLFLGVGLGILIVAKIAA